jgi:hypothetical protein
MDQIGQDADQVRSLIRVLKIQRGSRGCLLGRVAHEHHR